jgi:5-methylcytosine-specific restriction endonuclease McrA
MRRRAINRRRRWHPDCIEAYRLTWPSTWRRAIFLRDGGICAECSPEVGPHDRWCADHILPLIDGGDWTVENGQTLCEPHHKAKTAAENASRARKRKVAA